ncbi:MAG: phytanoyl-CoA dioxygenase family protein [Proteobacteria bacterium]|nr:phytanoyl-CoA dioxygenase family protein [Pseudomonadota bacterium]
MSDLSLTPPSFRLAPSEALAGFHERGFHIEPGLVPDDFCDRLISTANTKPNATDGTYRPIPMPHRQDPLFLEMMRLPAIVAIVETIVGGRASGLGGDFSYMRPGTPGWLPHQDNLYVQAPPDKFVSVWTALTDSGPENGSLVVYPGTHKLGELPIERLTPSTDPGQSPSAGALRAVLPTGVEPIDLRVGKGACLFFHSLLVHGSNCNASGRFRYSFLATYIRRGAPFRPGNMQKRTAVDLYEGADR